MDPHTALSAPRLIRHLQQQRGFTSGTHDIIRVRDSMDVLDRVARSSVAACSIAEHDVRTCESLDVPQRLEAYRATLQDMNLAMNNAVACRSYSATVNQVVNRLELETIARELDRAVAKRDAALKSMRQALAVGRPARSQAEEYRKCTQRLARLTAERRNVASLEIGHMYVDAPAVPGLARETPAEVTRRAENMERRVKVKTALLTRAECMRKKRAELLKAAGAPPNSRASKAELCRHLGDPAVGEVEQEAPQPEVESPPTPASPALDNSEDIKVVKVAGSPQRPRARQRAAAPRKPGKSNEVVSAED